MHCGQNKSHALNHARIVDDFSDIAFSYHVLQGQFGETRKVNHCVLGGHVLGSGVVVIVGTSIHLSEYMSTLF